MARAAGDVEGSLGFSSPFLITTYLSKTSYEKSKSYAQLKSARAEQMSATEIARFIPRSKKKPETGERLCSPLSMVKA